MANNTVKKTTFLLSNTCPRSTVRANPKRIKKRKMAVAISTLCIADKTEY